jgi:Ras-related protein Rab-11A
MSNPKIISPAHTFKHLILGDSGVGKTSILLSYINGFYDPEINLTVGIDFFVRADTINGEAVKSQFWDTSGQERFRSIMSSYFRSSNSCIVVYDVTKRYTFENVEYWMQEILKHLDIDDISLMLVGNKSDLESLRQVPTEEGEEVARRYGCMFSEVSALNLSNIHATFSQVVSDVYGRCSGQVDCSMLSDVKLDDDPIEEESRCACRKMK